MGKELEQGTADREWKLKNGLRENRGRVEKLSTEGTTGESDWTKSL